MGSQWKAGQDFKPHSPGWDAGFEFRGGGGGDFGDFGDPSDFFEALFGRGHGAAAPGVRAFTRRARIIAPKS